MSLEYRMPFQLPDRLQSLPAYLFADIAERKRAAVAAGRDVIDLGVGDPDQPTHTYILDAMRGALQKPANHRYPHHQGSPELRRCLAGYFQRRFGVALDPQKEIVVLIGTKEGLGHLPLAVINPGQTVLVPEPGYPAYGPATIFAGGKPWGMTLSEERGWLPDLSSIPPDVARSARLMFLNYPNNPTGAVATREFFAEAVAFARRHDLLIAQDAAYAEVYFDEPPPSILEIPGALDVAIEFHSASKTFNMTGWRLGFAVGNSAVVGALAQIKSNLDSGVFTAIQEAGIAAYEGIERAEIHEMRRLVRERAEACSRALREMGFRVQPARASLYVWAGVPRGRDSLGVARKALDEANVVLVPGAGFGPAGEGYVRLSMTLASERIREAMTRLAALAW